MRVYYFSKKGHFVTCLCRHRVEADEYLQRIRSLGARTGWVVSNTSWPLYPRERPGTVPTVEEAGGLGTENHPSPRTGPQTFQPVASRYTACAMPADISNSVLNVYCVIRKECIMAVVLLLMVVRW